MYPPADLAARVRATGAGAWPGFVPAGVLSDLGERAHALLASPHALRFPTSTRVWDLYRHGSAFVDLLEHPGLHELLDDLLGQDHLLSDHSLNALRHGGQPDRWHLDYPFNEMRHLAVGPLLGVQCVLTLDAFTPHSGATVFQPHSHCTPRHPPPDLDGGQLFIAEPGTLLVLAAATWHRSGVNTTTTPRAAILMSFVERWIRPMTGPPETGPWARSPRTRRLLGLERPPETIDGHPTTGPHEGCAP